MIKKSKFILPRYISTLGLLFSAFLIITSFSLEFFAHLNPCPLCLLQRWLIILIFLIFLTQTIHNPKKRKTVIIYAIINITFSILGGLIASRQIWLQSLPKDKVPPCGPDLYTLLDVAPYQETIRILFQDSGDCAKPSFILGLPLSQWGLISFILLFICSLMIIVKTKK